MFVINNILYKDKSEGHEGLMEILVEIVYGKVGPMGN